MRFEQVKDEQTPEEMLSLFRNTIHCTMSDRGSNELLSARERSEWMTMYNDSMIMKSYYQTEKELEDDWNKWCESAYDEKLRSDTMALKLYGLNNETIYRTYKRIFLKFKTYEGDNYNPDKSIFSRRNSMVTDVIQGIKTDVGDTTSYDGRYTIKESYAVKDDPMIDKLNQQAFDAIQRNGYQIITGGHKDLDSLDKEYYNYQSMSRDKRSKADTLSLQIYGIDNEEHYKQQYVDLTNDITGNDIIDDLSIPTYEPVEESSSNNLKSLLSVLEEVRNTTDVVRASKLAQYIKEDINPTSVVEETILKVIDDEVDKIAKKLEEEEPFGFAPYFLPDEIEELGTYSEDANCYGVSSDLANSDDPTRTTKDWLYNYYAKSVGLRPAMRWSNSRWKGTVELLSNRLGDPKLSKKELNITKQNLLEIGWNPEVPYTDSIASIASSRTNRRFAEQFNSRYKFIDISEAVQAYDKTSDKVDSIPKDDTPILTFYFFSSYDDSGKKIMQEVYIGLDINDKDKVYPIEDGLLKREADFDDIMQHLSDDVQLHTYVVGMAKGDMDKVADVVSRYSTNPDLSKYSMIKTIIDKLDIPMIIENEKLFCAYILDMIVFLADNPNTVLEPVPIEDITSRHIRKRSLRHVYLTYSGRANRYVIKHNNKQHFFGKFVKYSLAECASECTYIAPISICEVTSLPIEFDRDGNLFIKQKENINFAEEYAKCHKLLVQYSKAKGYEAMKYYVAKLWYINILIEKKLHDKKEYPKQQLTSWYNTRAHVLSDFKKYMGEILAQEPNFDFEKYYSTTPFDKSTLKVSNTFLRTIWNMFRMLFGLYIPSMPKKK